MNGEREGEVQRRRWRWRERMNGEREGERHTESGRIDGTERERE